MNLRNEALLLCSGVSTWPSVHGTLVLVLGASLHLFEDILGFSEGHGLPAFAIHDLLQIGVTRCVLCVCPNGSSMFDCMHHLK